MDKELLIQMAIKVREKAYAPYSGFKVGSALLTIENEAFIGCNVENISFSPTICAERNALFNAIANGYNKFQLIIIITDDNNPSPPCGLCRQVLSEFVDNKFQIICRNLEGKELNFTFEELFPHSFTPTVKIGKKNEI